MIRCTLLFILIIINFPLSAHPYQEVDCAIDSAIQARYFPGAQLVVGSREGIRYSRSYGYLDYSNRTPVDATTLYDLASCTKILATTLAIMRLYDEGQVSLDMQIGTILNEAKDEAYADVTIRELLNHDSGFRAGVGVVHELVKEENHEWVYNSKYLHSTRHKGDIQLRKNLFLDSRFKIKLDSMISAAYNPEFRSTYRYSDLNFHLLQRIIEQLAPVPFKEYIERIYKEMGVKNLNFNPMNWSKMERIAPTEYDPILRQDTIRGVVHDEFAFVQGGVCGNAGLFGTASSVAKICAMFIREGVDYRGKTILNASTIEKFTRAKHYRTGEIYGLGFNKVDPEKAPYSELSYGHSGFTGTYFWVDPERDIFMVLLTNRINPSRSNQSLNADYRAYMWGLVSKLSSVE